MNKYLFWLFFVLILVCMVSKTDAIVLTSGDDICIHGMPLDAAGQVFLSAVDADSLRVIVSFGDATSPSVAYDHWYEVTDPEVVITNGVLTFSENWEDIDGTGDTGVYYVSAYLRDASLSLDTYLGSTIVQVHMFASASDIRTEMESTTSFLWNLTAFLGARKNAQTFYWPMDGTYPKDSAVVKDSAGNRLGVINFKTPNDENVLDSSSFVPEY
jgi:hypothetical protein